MATTLSELHDNIENCCSVGLSSVISGDAIEISQQKLLVHLLLHFGHTHHDDGLSLWRQTFSYICFQTTEHEWPKDFVELRNHVLLGILIVNVEIEPFFKLIARCKDVGK